MEGDCNEDERTTDGRSNFNYDDDMFSGRGRSYNDAMEGFNGDGQGFNDYNKSGAVGDRQRLNDNRESLNGGEGTFNDGGDVFNDKNMNLENDKKCPNDDQGINSGEKRSDFRKENDNCNKEKDRDCTEIGHDSEGKDNDCEEMNKGGEDIDDDNDMDNDNGEKRIKHSGDKFSDSEEMFDDSEERLDGSEERVDVSDEGAADTVQRMHEDEARFSEVFLNDDQSMAPFPEEEEEEEEQEKEEEEEEHKDSKQHLERQEEEQKTVKAEQGSEPATCAGFEENLVLAVKDCFYEEELRKVLIRKTKEWKKVRYFSRQCGDRVMQQRRVCEACEAWFIQLTAPQPPVNEYSSHKEDISRFLDVKLEVTRKTDEAARSGARGRPKKKKKKAAAAQKYQPRQALVKSQSPETELEKTGEEQVVGGVTIHNLGEKVDNRILWVKGQRRRTRKYSEDRTGEGGDYLCRFENCDRTFDNKKAYLKHIYLIHEGGNEKRRKKKVCEHCGALITANNMKQHVRTVHTHKHEKNFACEHCGKEFKYRSELTVHLTHHTGEMNFSCSGCAKKFRRAAECRLCEKGHRGLFNYSCDICDYKTHKRHHLARHLKMHLKHTPFSCPICGFRSGRKDNLKQHVEKRHCSGSTTIEHLESLYPHMYVSQDSSDVEDERLQSRRPMDMAQSQHEMAPGQHEVMAANQGVKQEVESYFSDQHSLERQRYAAAAAAAAAGGGGGGGGVKEEHEAYLLQQRQRYSVERLCRERQEGAFHKSPR